METGKEIIVQDCKYRLPCNWCDKYNRRCEHIEFITTKMHFETIAKEKEKEEHEHNWNVIQIRESDYKDEDGNKYCNVYKYCSKCGYVEIKTQQIED